MMVAGLLRLLASSGVFFHSTTATTTVFMLSMHRADASSSSSSSSAAAAAAATAANDDTATHVSPAELIACDEDLTCSGCISVTETSSTEFWEFDAAGAGSSTSNEICAEGRRAMCSIDEASEFDCMGNGVYLEYVTCVLVESGCSIEDVSCPGEVEANNNNAGDMALDATQGGTGAEVEASSSSNSNSNSSSSISGSSVAITLALAFVFFAAGASVGVVVSATCIPGSQPFTRIKANSMGF